MVARETLAVFAWLGDCQPGLIRRSRVGDTTELTLGSSSTHIALRKGWAQKDAAIRIVKGILGALKAKPARASACKRDMVRWIQCDTFAVSRKSGLNIFERIGYVALLSKRFSFDRVPRLFRSRSRPRVDTFGENALAQRFALHHSTDMWKRVRPLTVWASLVP